MSDSIEQLHQKIDALQQDVTAIKRLSFRGIRRRSKITIFGLPLYDISLGPNRSKGEARGYARGIVAIGDVATGLLAIGGIARGLIALGGCAFGILLGFGGVATGVLAFGGLVVGGLAIGGLAVGIFAAGGVALGFAAFGGAALGYYACGGAAAGKYIVDAMQRDPEAVKFFSQWLPNFEQWFRPGG